MTNRQIWTLMIPMERRCALAFIVFHDPKYKRAVVKYRWRDLPTWLKDALSYRLDA